MLAKIKKQSPHLERGFILEDPKCCPQFPTGRQNLFLMSRYPEVLFGGQAGPGKTSALLMAATQYVHIPGYAAMLFRRTYQDLSLPGALMTGHRNGLGILRPDGM